MNADLVKRLRDLSIVGFGYDITDADRTALRSSADALARADHVRDAALEEAAKVADGIQYPDLKVASDLEKFAYDIRCNIASAIRALASKPQASADVVEALRQCRDYIVSPLRMTRDEDELERRTKIIADADAALAASAREGYNSEAREQSLCADCPPPDYPTDKTRCLPCPRRSAAPAAQKSGVR